jgi:hypothetical protein
MLKGAKFFARLSMLLEMSYFMGNDKLKVLILSIPVDTNYYSLFISLIAPTGTFKTVSTLAKNKSD